MAIFELSHTGTITIRASHQAPVAQPAVPALYSLVQEDASSISVGGRGYTPMRGIDWDALDIPNS